MLTANQPFTSFLVASHLGGFKYSLVWAKTRNSHPFFAHVRPLPQHEDICVFCEGKHTYHPQMEAAETPFRVNVNTSGKLRGDEPGKQWQGDSEERTMRFPTSVIRVSNPSREVGLHPTQKPIALMEYLIKTYTNEGETVLDNTMGSGTTCLAARNTGRRFIGIEKDEGYYKVACERLGVQP